MPSVPDWISVQRSLRGELLEGAGPRFPPARDLAARMLLYLDDPRQCWGEAARWLRDALGADRVDGGFHHSLDDAYVPIVEVQRPRAVLPSMLHTRFVPRATGDVATWTGPLPVFVPDVTRAAHLNESTRRQLERLGTRGKLTLPLMDGGRPVGMICADWSDRPAGPPAIDGQALAELSATVLAPVLLAARRLQAPDTDSSLAAPLPEALRRLTPGELRVARLVAEGLSYKEVARRLGRSFSTVDHQLRSIRAKLGAPSTARLTVLLSRLLARH